MAPPKIQTYHCLCTSLLLSSTHTLSTLPRRTPPSTDSISDHALILPLPSTPPLSTLSTHTSQNPEEQEENETANLPPQGYTVVLGLTPDRKTTIIRRADGFGFEKRILYRCSRCRLVVGYELQLPPATTGMDIDSISPSTPGQGKGKGREVDAAYEGKVLYILPGGVMSTD
ncbi:hypothetical protein IFR05_017089, partial [Cadophora sp. M221]